MLIVLFLLESGPIVLSCGASSHGLIRLEVRILNQATVLKIVVGIVALSPELELVVTVAGVSGVARVQNGIDGVVVI